MARRAVTTAIQRRIFLCLLATTTVVSPLVALEALPQSGALSGTGAGRSHPHSLRVSARQLLMSVITYMREIASRFLRRKLTVTASAGTKARFVHPYYKLTYQSYTYLPAHKTLSSACLLHAEAREPTGCCDLGAHLVAVERLCCFATPTKDNDVNSTQVARGRSAE